MRIPNNLAHYCSHNNASHVIQKFVATMGNQDHIEIVQEILAYFKENFLQIIETEYGFRIILQCFQFCTIEYQLTLCQEVDKHLDVVLEKEWGHKLVKHLLDESSIAIEIRKFMAKCLMNHAFSNKSSDYQTIYSTFFTPDSSE